MKKFFYLIAGLLCTVAVWGSLPTHIDNDLVLGGLLTPKVDAQDLGSSTFRWNAKLKLLPGEILVGGSDSVSHRVTMSGDVHIDQNGSTAIVSGPFAPAGNYLTQLVAGDGQAVAPVGGGASTFTLTAVGSASTYTKVTTDSKGRVTSGAALAGSDLPDPTSTTKGGVLSYAKVVHQWINSIVGGGSPQSSRPACGDLSDATPSCSIDATNASNSSSGTLPIGRLSLNTAHIFVGVGGSVVQDVAPSGDLSMSAGGSFALTAVGSSSTYTKVTTDAKGRVTSGAALAGSDLPDPTSITKGGVLSVAKTVHQWIDSIVGGGSPQKSQPACSDISDAASSCSIDATNASNSSSGTLPIGRLSLNTAHIFVGVGGSVVQDVAPSGDLSMAAGGSFALAAVGSASTYTKVTTDAKGRVTSGAALAGSDLPDPTSTTKGGVLSIVKTAHQWIDSIVGGGSPQKSQPACSDLSDAASSCSVDATNASNSSSGTLSINRLSLNTAHLFVGVGGSVVQDVAPSGDLSMSAGGAFTLASVGTSSTYTKATTDAKGRVTSGAALAGSDLPDPTSATKGGVLSFAKLTHQFLTSIIGGGSPQAAQPACSDLSDAASSCSVNATSATNITSGTLPIGRLSLNTAHLFIGVGGSVVQDVAPSGDLTMTAGGSFGLRTSGVTAGSYTSANITVDAQGRVTVAANGTGGGGSVGSPTNSTTVITPVNFGTISGAAYHYQQLGNMLHVWGYFVAGVTATATCEFTLVGFTIDTSFITTGEEIGWSEYLPTASTNYNSSNIQYKIFGNSGDSSHVFITGQGGAVSSLLYQTTNCHTIFGNTEGVDFNFWVPVL